VGSQQCGTIPIGTAIPCLSEISQLNIDLHKREPVKPDRMPNIQDLGNISPSPSLVSIRFIIIGYQVNRE
jgi:hypothetical protein